MAEETWLAVVRVRGGINLSEGIQRTFKHLNLHNSNWLTFIQDTPASRGMLKKIKDYITWGTVSPETIQKVLDERGEEGEGFTFEKKSYKRYVRLSPPRKGYGRKGVKKSFVQGGALGDRGDKITELIERMI